jgi:hypothetical protein
MVLLPKGAEFHPQMIDAQNLWKVFSDVHCGRGDAYSALPATF